MELGLAATQVGKSVRLIVIACKDEGIEPQALINPEIISKDGQAVMIEGCLSFPGIHAPVKRAESVKVKAQNLDGEEIEIDADGLSCSFASARDRSLEWNRFHSAFLTGPEDKMEKGQLRTLEAKYKDSK